MLMSEAQKPMTVPKELLSPPSEFNPTLLMFLAAIAMFGISNFGYWLWEWPHWCCFVTNTIALHICGTVIHDSCHQSAHRNRVINAILGHCSALLLTFAYPVFTRVHLQHHAHVNDPENDPDYYVSTGGPLWLTPIRFLSHEVFFFKRQLWRRHELLEWFLSRSLIVTIFCVSIQYHFLGYILNFWFIPSYIVGLALGLFFDYLPHRPHHERDRWKNARVYPNKVLNVLIMGQNYHLVHHLWPAIPWYNFQPAYYAMKPLLDEKGCDQSLGIFQGKEFLNFLYDFFIGIHFNSDKNREQGNIHT